MSLHLVVAVVVGVGALREDYVAQVGGYLCEASAGVLGDPPRCGSVVKSRSVRTSARA